MFAKRLLTMLFAAIMLVFMASVCIAEGDAVLSQAYAWEQNIDVFITGIAGFDNLSCKVSNQTAEVIESGALADGDIAVRTTILLDVSASIPSRARGNIRAYISALVENAGENEQFRLVTFCEELSVLQDFGAERTELLSAADQLVFSGMESMIYDAIYNTIPDVQPLSGSPCYYRTIIITDGVDDTLSGVTKEELYLKLQTDTYPLDVVEVSASQKTEQNKDLAALTRMSKGRYINLHAGTDTAALSKDLTVNDVFWFRAVVPGALLDGSIRQVDVSDGLSSVQFDLKIPVFAVTAAQTDEPTETPDESAGPERPEPTEKASPREHTPEPEDDADETPPVISAEPNNSITWIFIAAGLVVLIVVIVIITANGKKKGAAEGQLADYASRGLRPDNTEIIDAPPPNILHSTPHIRLRNMGVDSQVWDLGLVPEVLIGRDPGCQICVTDASVSRRQCKVYFHGVAVVENLSASNKTRLNGEPVNVPTAIKTGDRLICGRTTLLVESLSGFNLRNTREPGKGTVIIEV